MPRKYGIGNARATMEYITHLNILVSFISLITFYIRGAAQYAASQ